MRNIYQILLVIIFFTMIGCSVEDENLLHQPIIEENESVLFNRWVYSEMNHHYLWRDDLPDSISCDYSLKESDFFESVLSSKDRFSYITSNSNWKPNEKNLNLGFEFQRYRDKNGDNALQILYIYDSEAYKDSNLTRGDLVSIKSISGNHIILQKVDLIDNLFITSNIEEDINIYLKTNSETRSSVQLYKIFEDGGNRIGYVCYLEYDERDEIAEIMKLFYNNNITDLILDLRYNPGGYVSTCKYLCNCIVTENGYNNIFQKCSYNDILATENVIEYGSPYTYSYYDKPQETVGISLGNGLYPMQLKRLFVLTSKYTASASEATILCLNPFIEIIQIGETTIGKGVGSYTISNPKFRKAIQPITMRYFNANDETTPDSGLEPDYYIPDGYNTSKYQLGEIDEPLLNQALSLISPSTYASTNLKRSSNSNSEYNLISDGPPSYVIRFENKQIRQKQ